MDLTSALITAFHQTPAAACALLFCAGFISAFGPCGAQRFLGLVATTANRRANSTAVFFACGIACATATLLISSMLIRHLVATAQWTNLALAIICTLLGIVGLWRADVRECSHRRPRMEMTALSTTAIGFGSSLLIAPCCTPFIMLISAYAPEKYLAIDAIAYGCGAAFPYLIAGSFTHTVIEQLTKRHLQQAVQIVGSSLTLALGLLYFTEVSS